MALSSFALAVALFATLGAPAPVPPATPPPPPPAAADAATPPPATEPPPLKPGEFRWQETLAPRGPMLVLVSLAEQRATVYRNGVRIAESTVSTGKKGYETPTGVFTILQKRREHFSNLYDDAPMPFMQRLTWSGVALHAGRVPGYPASHGCVRLPAAFAEQLYGLTSMGMTVVIVDSPARAPMLADPGLFPAAPPPAALGTTRGDLAQPRLLPDAYTWAPELAPPGALTVVMSTRDRALVVLREGIEIGRGPVQVRAPAPVGTRAYVLLDGVRADVPGLDAQRPRRRWLRVHGEGGDDPAELAGVLSVDPGFAARLYDALGTGTSLVITDEPLGTASPLTVLEAEGAAGRETPMRSDDD